MQPNSDFTQPPAEAVDVVVGLGGNLGDVAATFERAICRIRGLPQTFDLQVSRHFETQPIGTSAGKPYRNAAVRFRSRLPPITLLESLQQIEQDLQRTRNGQWQPRTIDLDIVFFGDWQGQTDRLSIPHPHAWYRRFVLDPACDVAGVLRLPGTEYSLAGQREQLSQRPLPVGLVLSGESLASQRQEVHHRLIEHLPEAIREGCSFQVTSTNSNVVSTAEPAITFHMAASAPSGGCSVDEPERPTLTAQCDLTEKKSALPTFSFGHVWLPCDWKEAQVVVLNTLTAALDDCRPLPC